MSAIVAEPRLDVHVREATPADNDELLALASRCPMRGDVSLCVSRAPDFFALNVLEGDAWRVGVAEDRDGRIVGCVAVAARDAWVHGRSTRIAYASDLKVDPAHRRMGVADSLTVWGRDACRALVADDAPVLITVLAGNTPMERRAQNRRGMPHFDRIGTFRSSAISLLWRRRAATDVDLRITQACESDLEEMAELWTHVARGRQFAPAFDAGELARWIERAPDLEISSYRLARRANGRIAGFLALWDQDAFKQLRVVRYSPRLAAFRAGFNLAAPLLGAAKLPPAGGQMRYLATVHVCAAMPSVLRALLIGSYNEWRGRGYPFFTIGLDRRDPLQTALDGLFAQPTDVDAYACTPAGRWTGRALDDRPLHFETALV